MKKVFLATHNAGKIERYKKLLANTGLALEIFTPEDFGLASIEVEETGKTLMENAERKVHAYFGKVDMPILANDTGFWVKGVGFADAPKRAAVGHGNAKLSKEEAAATMLAFWQDIARTHGGNVDAAWIEAFALLDPDGKMHRVETRRDVILTDRLFGEVHLELPVRALYISKATGKPAAQHTKEEEIFELKPITDALVKLLSASE
ncbi:MAG TPA: non-canonical purine NTP pyrophosphatase [Candidatus Paceibacterota bacterium]|jgi:XTP/dITP diphosphohydrolase|nr:non-canonical purine NTP pyrophosphatase [Candidatus Paceibacterota bacterium]